MHKIAKIERMSIRNISAILKEENETTEVEITYCI